MFNLLGNFPSPISRCYDKLFMFFQFKRFTVYPTHDTRDVHLDLNVFFNRSFDCYRSSDILIKKGPRRFKTKMARS